MAGSLSLSLPTVISFMNAPARFSYGQGIFTSHISIEFTVSQHSLQILRQLLQSLLGILKAGSLHAHVELDLGLRAGGAGAAPGIVRQLEIEHIGFRQAGLPLFSGGHVHAAVRLVIPELQHLQVAERLGRVLAELLHDLPDLPGAVDAL